MVARGLVGVGVNQRSTEDFKAAKILSIHDIIMMNTGHVVYWFVMISYLLTYDLSEIVLI